MITLLRRRVMIAAGASPTPPEPPIPIDPGDISNYVIGGLVLHLDGIEKGADNTEWVDRTGNYTFTNYGATFNANHLYFDGVDDYLFSSIGPAILCASGTIEVVYEKDAGNTMIFMPDNTSNVLAFGWSNGYLVWSAGHNRSRFPSTPDKASVSISLARAICNGSAITSSGSTYFSGGKTNEFYVGKRNYSSGNYYKGKIYSIRIYNRQLTQDEVLANMAVDNIRFNLGLTL